MGKNNNSVWRTYERGLEKKGLGRPRPTADQSPTRFFQSFKEIGSDDFVRQPIFRYGRREDENGVFYRRKINCEYGEAKLVDFIEIDKTKFKTAIAKTEAEYDRIVLYSNMPIDKSCFEKAAFPTTGAIKIKQSNGDVGMIMMDKRTIVDIFKEGVK